MNENECSVFKPTLWQRLQIKLFPYRRAKLPSHHGHFAGFSTTSIIMDLDWKDRIRALISGQMEIEVRAFTENNPGEISSFSTGYVIPPFRKYREEDLTLRNRLETE